MDAESNMRVEVAWREFQEQLEPMRAEAAKYDAIGGDYGRKGGNLVREAIAQAEEKFGLFLRSHSFNQCDLN